jgi:hypothetical protein
VGDDRRIRYYEEGPSGTLANDSIARSTSAVSLLIWLGMSSIARAGAAAWAIARSNRIFEFWIGDERDAGEMRRDLLEHREPLPQMPLSYCIVPVSPPPGRAKLVTKPEPTGCHFKQ